MATDPYQNWTLDAWKKVAAGGEWDAYNETWSINPQQRAEAAKIVQQMEAAGVPYSYNLYGQDAPISKSPKTFGDQFKAFVTNPAFLVAAGGVAGVAGAGAGAAGAGAGEGAYGAGYGVGNATTAGAAGAGTSAAGAGAATGLGSGITTGAGGQTGITAGTATGGIGGGGLGSGLTTGGAGVGTGTAAAGAGALGTGFFGSETAYPVAGGQTAAAGGAGTTSGIGGSTATTAGGSTALQRILAGNGTGADYLSVIGQVAPSLLSAYGSSQQAGDYKDLANKYMAMGAPYRDELSRISADPSAFYTSPTATKATEAVLQRLSSQYGNPAGNPYAQSLTLS